MILCSSFVRYSWHRFGFLEDCRIFAGWRFDPIDLESWSYKWEQENKKSWYFKESLEGSCGSCGHPEQGDDQSSVWAGSEPTEHEVQLGFRTPLCSWCSFRLKLFREGVVPRTMTGDLEKFRHQKLAEMAARSSSAQPPDDCETPPPHTESETETTASSEHLVEAAAQALSTVLPESVENHMTVCLQSAQDDANDDDEGEPANPDVDATPQVARRPVAARSRPRYGL